MAPAFAGEGAYVQAIPKGSPAAHNSRYGGDNLAAVLILRCTLLEIHQRTHADSNSCSPQANVWTQTTSDAAPSGLAAMLLSHNECKNREHLLIFMVTRPKCSFLTYLFVRHLKKQSAANSCRWAYKSKCVSQAGRSLYYRIVFTRKFGQYL